MPNDTKVPVEPNGEVAEDATLTTGVEATEVEATPGKQTEDAGKLAEIEAVKAKYEADLNAMKSSLQRNEAKQRQEFASKQEQFEQQLEELRVANMDEDQRKQYEAGSAVRKLQQMEQKLYEVENEKIEKEATLKAYDYFLKNGVPADVLDMSGDYEVFWESGMDYITSELQQLRQAAPAKTVTKVPPVEAPPVVTQSNTPASTGTNWDSLVKKYGDEETVYRLVETGQLDASVIPASK